MMSLKDCHPAAHEAFQAGNFVVQHSGITFSQVAVDQTIEETINRDTNSKGGIIGYCLNKGSVQQWLLTSNERAAITQAYHEMARMSMTNGEGVIKKRSKGRMSVDENKAKKVQSTPNIWGNPFSPPDTDAIWHLVSGMTALKTIKTS